MREKKEGATRVFFHVSIFFNNNNNTNNNNFIFLCLNFFLFFFIFMFQLYLCKYLNFYIFSILATRLYLYSIIV